MAIIEDPHVYNMISDTFKANPEEISIALQWRQKYLEKEREYNKQYYHDKTRSNTEQYEASKQRSKEWFQNNKERAAARQKARYENDPDYKCKVLENKKFYYMEQKKRELEQLQGNN